MDNDKPTLRPRANIELDHNAVDVTDPERLLRLFANQVNRCAQRLRNTLRTNKIKSEDVHRSEFSHMSDRDFMVTLFAARARHWVFVDHRAKAVYIHPII